MEIDGKPEYNYYDLDNVKPDAGAIELPRNNESSIAGGTVMTGGDKQSINYAKGASGWRIGADGDAEFQNITARGTVTANTLNIGGITEITVTTSDNLQTALNTINTIGGGTLRLSPGEYTINADLTVYDNTKIIGDTSNNTILNFNSQAFSIILVGTDIYTTGTISSITTGTTVNGSGTVWTAAMIGRQILINNRWYVIVNRVSDTQIIIATGYADGSTFSGTYRIANPINNVTIKGVTIKNSTTYALEGTDVRDVTLNDVVFLSNNKGFFLTNFMNVSIDIVTIASSTSNGFELTNGSFLNTSTFSSVSNGGSGGVLNTIKSCTFIWSAANSNTTDGYNLTSVINCAFKLECSSNGSNGIELVSGCNSCFINDSLISNNTSDGIKLTATSDNNTIGGAVLCDTNGGYGINIAASTCDNNTILAVQFKTNVSGTYIDSGTNTEIIQEVVASTSYIYGTTSNVTISNDTAETTITSFSVPGGTLGTTGFVKGRIYINSLALAASGSVTIRLKYGATTVVSTVLTESAGLKFSGAVGWIDILLSGAGTTSSQEGLISLSVRGTNGSIDGNQNTPYLSGISISGGTATEVSTGALNLVVTSDFNSASVDSSVTYVIQEFTKNTP